jgi:SAM-dependent methyltransferase
MCHRGCLSFAHTHLTAADVAGQRVLEVGSRDVNGSVRPIVESLGPCEYVGVDIEAGPSVDLICRAEDLVKRFGASSFDIVISTELLEHVRDWRSAVSNMKTVLRPGGTLLLTTRSRGFHLHGYPWDYWRFELDDMRAIFGEFDIDALEADAIAPGVFLKASKPASPSPVNLSQIRLYSVITQSRKHEISATDEAVFKVRFRIHRLYRNLVPERIRARVKRVAASHTARRTLR